MFPESAKTVQNAAVRMAMKRTVVLLKAYADAQAVGLMEDGTVSQGGSAAYSMLTAAFAPAEHSTHGGQPSAGPDLGQIFRIITGAKLRDVDADGNLIEQVRHARYAHRSSPGVPASLPVPPRRASPQIQSTSAHQAMSEAEERRYLRSEMRTIRDEMSEVHKKLDNLTALLTARA